MTDQQSDQRTEEAYDEERRRRERKKKEVEKTKSKDAPKTEPRGETSKPERLEIPIVRLNENAEIKIEGIEIDKEIPDIKEEEPKVSIPIVELEKPSIELKEFALDKVLPEIEADERKLEVPLIKQDKPREVRCAITAFDNRPPHIHQIIRRIPRVPIYRISPQSTVRDAVPSFDSRVDSRILQRIGSKNAEDERREKTLVERQEKVGVSAGGDTGGEPSDSEEEVEEKPDIIDFVFGVYSSKISSGGPKVVLYKELEEDSTIGSFETLCIRIYRERHGGKPEFRPRKTLDEFNTREIERWDEPDRRISTIDLDDDEGKSKKWFCKEKLRELLGRAVTGDVGFIIFKTRNSELYEHCKTEMEYSKKEIEHPLDVVYVEPKPLSFEVKKELSSLAWGNPKLDSIPPVILIEEEKVERPYGAFDDIFNKHSQEEFKKHLERLEGSSYSNATKPHESEESNEHKEMKWFVVRYLTKRLIKEGILKPGNHKPRAYEIMEEIRTEADTKEELRDKVADVMDIRNREVYEIETLFAQDREGKTVEEKLNYTIDKYRELDIRKINIVLDNFTFLRHLKTLLTVKENKPKEEREKLEFYTLDIQNEKLLPLGDVIKKVKQLFKPASSQF